MLPFTQCWVDSYFQIKEAKAIKLEACTRRQSLCSKWHDAREWRLTASRFGDVTHMTARRNVDKLCDSICFPPVLSGPPVIHGLKFETVASKCGVFVHLSYPYLGATPDGVIDDDKIIEIKCPYTGNIAPGKYLPSLEYLDGGSKVRLSRHSRYYSQIQGQLYLSKHQLCFFIIFTHKDLYIEKIEVDNDYCKGPLLRA
ncbi:hypothetical protein SNE40_018256 [Patella caerulea]|uniref:YqaJ viral recombinase domain-containing protein n=1 Tax=Patella caerulea TaxID=87958 RepID=A0AAN8JAL0_PATCE